MTPEAGLPKPDTTEIFSTAIIHTLKKIHERRELIPRAHATREAKLKAELARLASDPTYEIVQPHGAEVMRDVYAIDPEYSLRLTSKMIEALENLSEC